MIQDHKICKECQTDKVLTEFPKNSSCSDGTLSRCKLCENSRRKSIRDANLEEHKRKARERYHKDLEKSRASRRKYLEKSRENKKQYDKLYRPANKEKIAGYKKEWEKKMRHDPIFKIKRNLRRRVHHAISGGRKADKTFALIGCSPDEFKKHIESQWKEGMSWENYNPTGWHIDHIIPCHLFDLTKEEEQRKCFHYTNQRPLWAWENLGRSKRDPLAAETPETLPDFAKGMID